MVTKPQLRWVFPCWQHSSLWSVTTASTNRGYKGTLKSYHWSLCYCVRNGTREPKIEIWDKNLALNHSLARQPSKREAVWAITRRDGKLNTKSTSEGRICPFRLPVLSVPKLGQDPGTDSCPCLSPLPSLPRQEQHNSSVTEGQEQLPGQAQPPQTRTHTPYPSTQGFQQLCAEAAKNKPVNIHLTHRFPFQQSTVQVTSRQKCHFTSCSPWLCSADVL